MSRQRKLADLLTQQLGIAIVPSGVKGQRFSTVDGWEQKATTDMAKVDEWLANMDGQLWICCARKDGVGCLDIDDEAACLAKGMPPLPADVYRVRTPSGGLHVPFAQNEETRTLCNAAVYGSEELTDTNYRSKILEVKGNNTAWCAPHQTRDDGGKYTPECEVAPMTGMPADLLAWIRVTARNLRAAEIAPIPWEFADEFDLSEFLEHNMANLLLEYDEGGSTWVTLEECPICGQESRAAKKGAQIKFIFSGRGYGFVCHFCSTSGHEQFEQRMIERHPDWEPWSEPIYKEIPLDLAAMGVEDADAPKPSKPKVRAKLGKITVKDTQRAIQKQHDEEPPTFVSRDHPAITHANDPTVFAVGEVATKQGPASWAVHAVKASSIPPLVKRWLWPKRFVANAINLFAGKGDCGKSFVLIDVVARLTRGADWPDDEKNYLGPIDVLMICSEDDKADTIIPRLMAAGADLDRVLFLTGLTLTPIEGDAIKRPLALKKDMEKVQTMLNAHPEIRVLAFDPISGNLGVEKDDSNSEVRQVLEALNKVLSKTRVSMLGIIHYNKSSDQDPVQKILGAGAWGHIARMVWAFSKDPEDKLQYFMSKAKGNSTKIVLGKSGLKYAIEDRVVQVNDEQPDGSMLLVPSTQGYVEWRGDHDMDASDVAQHAKDVASGKAETAGPDTETGRARLLLKSELENGKRPGRDMHQLREKNGITDTTMRRAFKALGGQYVTVDGKPWPKGSKLQVFWEIPMAPDALTSESEAIVKQLTGQTEREQS